MIRGLGYCRVSGHDAAKRGYSLPEQDGLIRRYAEAHGITLVDVLREQGSGADWDLVRVREVIARAEAREFDVLVVKNTSRFARDPAKIYAYEALLRAAGVRVIYVEQDYEDSPEGELHKGIHILFDQHERARARKRSMDVVRDKVAVRKEIRGGGPSPYGLVKVRNEHGRPVSYAPDPLTAPIVRRIFAELPSRSSAAVADGLNADGIPGPRGGRWSPSVVREIAGNPAYRGEVAHGRRIDTRFEMGKRRYGRRPPEDWLIVPVPPLVTPEVHERANRALRERVSGRGPTPLQGDDDPFLLRRRLRCGLCGSRLSTSRDRNSICYYRCDRTKPWRLRLLGGERCPLPAVRAPLADAAVRDALARQVLHPVRIERTLRALRSPNSATRLAADEQAAVRKELDARMRRLEKLESDTLDLELADPDSPRLEARHALATALSNEIRGLRARLQTLQAARPPILDEPTERALREFAAALRERVCHGSAEELRRHLATLELGGTVYPAAEDPAGLGVAPIRIEWSGRFETVQCGVGSLETTSHCRITLHFDARGLRAGFA